MRGENPTQQTEAKVRYLVMVEMEATQSPGGQEQQAGASYSFLTYLGSTEDVHLRVPEHILLLLLTIF